MALLLPLVTAERVSELHTLFFPEDNSTVLLHTNLAFGPDVVTKADPSVDTELTSFCPPPLSSDEAQRLHIQYGLYIRTWTAQGITDHLTNCLYALGQALSKQRHLCPVIVISPVLYLFFWAFIEVIFLVLLLNSATRTCCVGFLVSKLFF